MTTSSPSSSAIRPTAPPTLLRDEGGRIASTEPTPYPGSDTWAWGGWRPITPDEAAEFEREAGSPPVCETSAARARRVLI